MKKTLLTIKQLFFMAAWLTTSIVWAGTSYSDDFTDGTVPDWDASVSGYFSLSEANGYLSVDVDAAGGEDNYQAFSLKFDAVDMSDNPYVKLLIRSEADFSIRIDMCEELSDGTVLATNAEAVEYSVTGDDGYKQYVFDFTDKFYQLYPDEEDLDPTNISMAMIYINPNADDSFTGTIDIDNFRVGSAATDTDTIFEDDFEDDILPAWDATTGSGYSATETDGKLAITGSSVGGESGYESFGIHFDMVDLSDDSRKYITVNVKTTEDLYLRADVCQEIGDGTSLAGNESANVEYIEADGDYHEVTFSLDDDSYFYQLYGDTEGELDETAISFVQFYFNAGEDDSFSGTVYFEDMVVGATSSNNNSDTSTTRLTYFLEDFSTMDSTIWDPEEAFTVTQVSESLQIDADQTEDNCNYCSIWGAIEPTTKVPVNISSHPYVRVKVKIDTDFDLRVDLQDQYTSYTTNGNPEQKRITGDETFHTYLYDFTDKFYTEDGDIIDSTEITSFLFFPNPGEMPFQATFFLDDLEIGYSPMGTAPEFSAIAAQESTSPKLTIDLASYISDDETADSDIIWAVKTTDSLSASVSSTTLSIEPGISGWNGTDTVIVYATDEEGWQVSQEISVTFDVLSDNADLNSLTVSEGTLSPSFDAADTVYTVALTSSVSKVPSVTAVADDDDAEISVDDASELPGITTVTVTAEDGSVKTYTINFEIEYSDDATLSDILLSSGTLDPEFNADTIAYSVVLQSGSDVPAVTAIKNDSNAELVYTNASTIPDTTVITVTAEDGETTMSYTVSFSYYVPSSNADLSSLTAGSYTLSPDFGADVTEYTVTIDRDASIPTVVATTDDDLAEISYSQSTSFSEAATVTVTAEDGTQKIYTLTFDYVLSDNADLKSLSTDEGTLTPSFDADETEYTVEIASTVTEIPEITVTVDDDSASVSVSDATTLDGSTVVTVTAENGTTKIYTVDFDIVYSSDADLASLRLSSGNLNPEFDADITSYTVKLSDGTTTIPTVAAVANSELAQSVEITQASELPGTASVIVTAEDGTEKTYTINFELGNPEGFTEDFNDNFLHPYWSSGDEDVIMLYERLFDSSGSLKVNASEAGGEDNYYTFALSFSTIDISENPVVTVKMKSESSYSSSAEIRVDLISGNEDNGETQYTTNADPIVKTLYSNENTATFTYNFSGHFTQSYPSDADVDDEAIDKIVFYINGGVDDTFTGSIYIDEIIIGDEVISRPTEYIEDFEDESVDHIASSEFDALTLSEEDNQLKIVADAAGGEDSYETFLFSFPEVNMSGNPYISIDVKADEDFTLRIDPSHWSVDDADYILANENPAEVDITGDGEYHTYVLAYTDRFMQSYPSEEEVEANRISNLYMYINANTSESFSGTVYIDNITLGQTPDNLPPVITVSDIVADAGDVIPSIDLSDYISDDNTDFNDLIIEISGGDEIAPSISNGTLSFSIEDATWYGEETFTLSVTDGDGLQAKATVTVTVEKVPVTEITLSETDLTMTHHDTIQLSVTIYPDNATIQTVTWASSNTEVVSVDEYGEIIALAPGTATVTVSATDDDITATCNITVDSLLVSSIELEKDTISIEVDDSRTLLPEVYPSNASTTELTFSSSDNSIVTVTSDGTITANAAGTAYITVSSADGAVQVQYVISVVTELINKVPVVASIPSQSITAGDSFEEVNLEDYVSDDITPFSQLEWSVADCENYKVTVSNGILYVAPLSTTWTGSEEITITVTDEGGLSTDFFITYEVTGSETAINSPQNSNIEVYPTINNGTFTISIDDEYENIELFNIQGTKMPVDILSRNDAIIVIANVRNGQYFVKITTKYGTTVKPVFIK